LTYTTPNNYNTFGSENESNASGDIRESSTDKTRDLSIISIVKHDNTFMEAMFNFLKSFIGIGVISVAGRVENAGIGLAVGCIIFSAALSLYGTNITVSARSKILKDNYAKQGARGRHTIDIMIPERLVNSEDIDENRLSVDHALPHIPGMMSETQRSADTHDLILRNTFIKAYAEMGQACYGDFGFSFCTTVLFIQSVSGVIAYISFYDEYFKAYYVVPLLIPMSMFFDLKMISYSCMISIFLIFSGLLLIIGISISDIPDNHSYDELKYTEFLDFPLFFGVAMFMFEGDVIAMNIQDSMQKPKQFKMLTYIGLSIVTVFAIA
jgi:amino acid permease